MILLIISLVNFQHDFPTITKWYKKLSQDHSGLVKVQDSIGVTEEGRHLSAVHITADAQDMATNKPKFYMQCLIHASELGLDIFE